MVESSWNMALATLYRISTGIDMCNEAMNRGDFASWLKGIYWFYGELSTWMKPDEQADFMVRIQRLKLHRHYGFEDNLYEFFLATQFLRRIAHTYKLLLKEEDDTNWHGGN